MSLIWISNSEPDIKGYNVYFGVQSGAYDAPNSPTFVQHPTTNAIITGLQNTLQYYFSLTALDFSGNESLPSVEITTVASEDPPQSDTTPPSISQGIGGFSFEEAD